MRASRGSRGPAPAVPATHECPGPGCTAEVSATRLACKPHWYAIPKPHWYAIPKPLRDAVWRSWRNGNGAGSPEHQAAISDAVAALIPSLPSLDAREADDPSPWCSEPPATRREEVTEMTTEPETEQEKAAELQQEADTAKDEGKQDGETAED